MNERPPHIKVLNDLIAEFRLADESRSLRDFAESLNVNSGTLTQILSAKRKMPINMFHSISEKFTLNSYQLIQLSQGLSPSALRKVKTQTTLLNMNESEARLEDVIFQILSEWHHFAILSLMQTTDFQPNAHWISQRLGLAEKQVSQAVENLKAAGLIKQNTNGQWLRTNLTLEASEELYNRANNRGHLKELLMALSKVKSADGDIDNFSSMTIPIDIAHVDELHELTDKYQNQVESLSRKGIANEVYTVNIQFYPVSKPVE